MPLRCGSGKVNVRSSLTMKGCLPPEYGPSKPARRRTESSPSVKWGRWEALGTDLLFAHREFEPVDLAQREMFMDPKQNPILQNRGQFVSAVLQRGCVGIHPAALGNLAVMTSVIRKDLLPCVPYRGLEVFGQHVCISSTLGRRTKALAVENANGVELGIVEGFIQRPGPFIADLFSPGGHGTSIIIPIIHSLRSAPHSCSLRRK